MTSGRGLLYEDIMSAQVTSLACRQQLPPQSCRPPCDWRHRPTTCSRCIDCENGLGR